jgi:hypothetical protein
MSWAALLTMASPASRTNPLRSRSPPRRGGTGESGTRRGVRRLGLRRRRVLSALGRIEVIEVRYEAGQFGRGFKAEPKSLASVRVGPMCEQVRQAIARQLSARRPARGPGPPRARGQQRHPAKCPSPAVD